MTLNVNLGAMATLIDGKAEITSETVPLETLRLKLETAIKTDDSSFERMASRDGQGLKAAGSETIMHMMHLIQRKRDPRFETVNGAVTDMAQTVTGPGEPSLSRSLSGWTRRIEKSLGRPILKRTLNVGKRE